MKKTLIIILLSMFMLTSISGAKIVHYTFNNTLANSGTDPGLDLSSTSTNYVADYPVYNISGNGSDYAYDVNNNANNVPATNVLSNELDLAQSTISLWFKADVNSITTDNYMFRLYKSGNDFVSIRREADDEDLYFMVRDGGTYLADTKILEFDNDQTYHHVAMVLNNTECLVYIDAALVLTDSTCGSLLDVEIQNLAVGAYATSLFWEGIVDEFHIYDEVVSAENIKSIYNTGSTFVPTDISVLFNGTQTSEYYNLGSEDTNITINLNNIGNISYRVDGGSSISLANNTNTTSFTYNTLSLSPVELNFTAITSQDTFSQVITVNPTQYFSFLNDSGQRIENYTFGGKQDLNGFVNFSIVDTELSIGANSLFFSKQGFVAQNFSFNLNRTQALNTTFNVTLSNVTVRIYDFHTEQLITDLVDLTLEGPVGLSQNTTTGIAVLSIPDSVPGDYRIVAVSSNYETEQTFFSYDGQENISANIYMINKTGVDTGYVTVEVKAGGSFVDDAIVKALAWDPDASAYLPRSECQTITDGKCDLNIELNNVIYKFSAQKSGVISTTSGQRITETGILIPIALEDAELTVDPDLEGLAASFTEQNNLSATNYSLTRLEWSDTNGAVQQACINVYTFNGFTRQLNSQNCTTGSSGILFSTNLINNTYTTEIDGVVIYGGTTRLIDSFTYKGVGDLSKSLEDAGIDFLIPIAMLFLGIALGIFFGKIYISVIAGIILLWFTVTLLPVVIPVKIAVVSTVIGGLIIWGVIRK